VTATVTDANHQVGSTSFTWSVTARVPELVGLHQGEAQGLITAAGLTLGGVSVNNDCVAPGDVTIENPTGGSTAPVGSPVHITVSSCTSRGGGGDGGPIVPK
jgi:beta-lactam-binding protein with PASTA domain